MSTTRNLNYTIQQQHIQKMRNWRKLIIIVLHTVQLIDVITL